jgi:hypothetical protein
MGKYNPRSVGEHAMFNRALLLTSRDGVYNSSGFVVTDDASKQRTLAECWRLEVWLRRALSVCFWMLTGLACRFAGLSPE